MAFKYLWYETLEEAQAQSRAKWTEKLGRPKRPQDTTEYIWGWYGRWPDNAYYLLEIPESDFGMLAPPEIGDLLERTDPLVVACFPKAPWMQ